MEMIFWVLSGYIFYMSNGSWCWIKGMNIALKVINQAHIERYVFTASSAIAD